MRVEDACRPGLFTIRLLEGMRDRLEEVDLPGVPLRVRDALQGEEAQKQLQLHVADRGGEAARGIFHGHGSAGDVQEERVLRYFRTPEPGLLSSRCSSRPSARRPHVTTSWPAPG